MYTDAVAADVEDRIDGLLTKYHEVRDLSVKKALSERDVLLITYGDTLSDGRRLSLQVLHRFHCKYLRDTFDLVHILPFQPYSSDDGFSVIDYYAVREDLGDWGDIERLSRDCHVMVDAVINHMSSQSPWFKRFLAGDPQFADFFVECDPTSDLSAVVRPRTSPLLTRYVDSAGRHRHIWTTFSADQVDLNYRSPDVLIAVIDVLFFLILRGARLLRLDAVTYLWKEPGTSSANMRETHAIIKIIRSAVSALRSDVVVITETNVPHRENTAYFGNGRDEAHAVYNFALPPLIAHSFIQGDGRRLSGWARQLQLPGDEVCFLNFTASHDGVGIRPVEDILDSDELEGLVTAARSAGGMVSSRTMQNGEEKPYELNCSFLDLISRPGDTPDLTVRRFVASQAIVLAMPGVPAIYIHSLLGTRNDQARVEKTGRARSINRSRLDISSVEDALSDKSSMTARVFDELTRIIRVRRQESAFDPYGGFRVLDFGRDVFALERRSPDDGHAVFCVANLTDRHVSIALTQLSAATDLLTGQVVRPGKVDLSPYQVCWIRHE